MEELLNLEILELGARLAALKVCETIQNLLSYSVLVIVLDDFKVELAAHQFDMCPKLLFEDLLLYLLSSEICHHLFHAELLMDFTREELLAFMVFLAFLHFFVYRLGLLRKCGHLLLHICDFSSLLANELIVLVVRFPIFLFFLQDVMLDLIVECFVGIAAVFH